MVRGFCIGNKSCPVAANSLQNHVLNGGRHCWWLAGGVLNMIITLQILCYAKNTQAQTKKLAKKKE